MQPYGASLAAYAIDKQGYLLLPLIGNIYVKDKTTSQVSAILKDSLSSILNQPIVYSQISKPICFSIGGGTKPGPFRLCPGKTDYF